MTKAQQFGTAVEAVEMFTDCSGATMLVSVGGYRFSCVMGSADKVTVTPLMSRGANASNAQVRAGRHAEAVFTRDVMAHLTPDYLARNRAMYA